MADADGSPRLHLPDGDFPAAPKRNMPHMHMDCAGPWQRPLHRRSPMARGLGRVARDSERAGGTLTQVATALVRAPGAMPRGEPMWPPGEHMRATG
jgi:hypothetical protein